MTSKPSQPIIDMPSKQQLKKLVRPLTDQEINKPAMDEKIENLMKFFEQYGIEYDKFKPEFRSFIPEKKKAYPNYDQYQYNPGQHDTQKWLLALKNIAYRQKAGLPYKEAIKTSTQGWQKMEIYDFLNWLKFYNEGTPMKYKFAQVWYENGQPGYFLHIKPDTSKEEVPVIDHNAVQDAHEEAARQEEKRSVIEKQRQKIIGRLDSAEKLLRSPEGQQFAGSELEQLMEAIYTLKKKVQLVNKLSVSTRLYEDMIVREGNVLKRSGFDKAAEVLYSLAQSPGQSGESANGMQHGGKVPMDGQSPMDPSGAGQSGMPNGYVNLSVNDPTQPANVNEFQPGLDALSDDDAAPSAPTGSTPPPQTGPAPTDPTAQSTPAIMPQGDVQPKGIKDFIENMNDGTMTEASEADDQLEVFDDELMVTEAQVAPPGVPPAALEEVPTTTDPPPDRGDPVNLPAPTPKAPAAPQDEPLEVTENDIPGPDSPSGGDNSALDSKIDATFDSVTMEEIVAELEDISKYYKVREMPRRLARLDMMFDSKGISAYFPSLAEAQNRALDANNYIATRIDDILSKVRGSLASENMAGKLQQDQDKEKKRKEMRKEQENADLEGGAGKAAPEVEMGELAPPTAPTPPPPVATPPPALKRPAV
jgi:hypothetical protein